MPSYTIIAAPTTLGLRPSGVKRLADALLASGLADHIGAEVAARVEASTNDPVRDPISAVLDPDGIADFLNRLADSVDAATDAATLPVALGGDCSVLISHRGRRRASSPRPLRPVFPRRSHRLLGTGAFRDGRGS